ncbi:hypothetical protein ACP70R_031107 [Stipagrostis hirtigluma subsp. patula]
MAASATIARRLLLFRVRRQASMASPVPTADSGERSPEMESAHYFFESEPTPSVLDLIRTNHSSNRAKLLSQLLEMGGNFGDIPDLMIDFMEI